MTEETQQKIKDVIAKYPTPLEVDFFRGDTIQVFGPDKNGWGKHIMARLKRELSPLINMDKEPKKVISFKEHNNPTFKQFISKFNVPYVKISDITTCDDENGWNIINFSHTNPKKCTNRNDLIISAILELLPNTYIHGRGYGKNAHGYWSTLYVTSSKIEAQEAFDDYTTRQSVKSNPYQLGYKEYFYPHPHLEGVDIQSQNAIISL